MNSYVQQIYNEVAMLPNLSVEGFSDSDVPDEKSVRAVKTIIHRLKVYIGEERPGDTIQDAAAEAYNAGYEDESK